MSSIGGDDVDISDAVLIAIEVGEAGERRSHVEAEGVAGDAETSSPRVKWRRSRMTSAT